MKNCTFADAHFNILKTIDFPKVNVIRIEKFAEEFKYGER
jgi:hypothetical protein